MTTFLITGGAGFIGSALVRMLIEDTDNRIHNLDKLTYAGNLESLLGVTQHERYAFHKIDICDAAEVERVLQTSSPDVVVHLAAETHVDRSIDGPADFVRTNVLGTFTMLQQSLDYWRNLSDVGKQTFRFIHVSTDEVYGTLGASGAFTESTAYAPNSPYAASKAGSDHLARAWFHTYGLPVITTNCSNNYGPFQFPEKLIPLMILNALAGRRLPVYGRGDNVRDWLFVDDHCRALLTVAEHGRIGSTYNIGGTNEHRNIDVVHAVTRILDELMPDSDIADRSSLVDFVEDRPGHDRRYAIDATKIREELGWYPQETFESGLRKTVAWYVTNRDWCSRVQSGAYRGERLGLGGAR